MFGNTFTKKSSAFHIKEAILKFHIHCLEYPRHLGTTNIQAFYFQVKQIQIVTFSTTRLPSSDENRNCLCLFCMTCVEKAVNASTQGLFKCQKKIPARSDM